LWKVADFGYVSKCSSDKLQDIASGNSRGTVGFRAPELQHTAAPTYNAFSDIWSMGCILYELAFGKKAFEDDWQARRIAESDKSLEYPVDSLGSWDPTSKEALAKLLDRMLDRMAIMRPTASNLSDIFEKLSGYAAATDRPHSAPLSERPETLLDSHSPPAIPARETDMPEQHADENAAVGSLEVRSPPPNPAMETNIRISGQRPDTEQRLIPETVTDSLEVQSQGSMDAMDSNIHFADYANTQDGIIPFQTVFDSLTVQSEPPIDPVLLVGYGHNSPESNSTDSNTPLDTEMPDADENSDLGSINRSPFTCPKCKYSFKREPDLRRHLETVHVQQDNWCNHCPKDEAKRYARHDGLMVPDPVDLSKFYRDT
jgi:serine/threonine protein kinase